MCVLQSVSEGWFHGHLSRADAEKRLRENGEFLVRTNRLRPGELIVTLQSNSEKLNFICPRTEAR